jgi:hypothetical protein
MICKTFALRGVARDRAFKRLKLEGAFAKTCAYFERAFPALRDELASK